MAYRVTINIALGSGHTGLTLKAQLVDTTGANVGSAITTGFVEIGAGNYLWDNSAVPAGHRGGVKFINNADDTLLAFTSISPEDVELVDHLDADVSSRLATTDYTTPDNTTIANTYNRIGAPAGASIAADLAEIEVETDDISAMKSVVDTNLDVKVSTRLATSGYTVPDNTDIVAIKAKTDNLPSDPASQSVVDAQLVDIDSEVDSIKGTVDTNLDAKVSTRSTLTADQVDNQLSGSHGVGEWTTPNSANDPLSVDVPASYPPGSVGYVIGHLSGLEVITNTAPTVTDAGDVLLVKGQDYLRQDSNQVTWSGNSWPNLANAHVHCEAFDQELDMNVDSNGVTKIVSLSLDDEVTKDLVLNRYRYKVVAQLSNGDKFVLAEGRVLFD